MSLHPVLAEKLSAALAPTPDFTLTRRDAQLLAVPGKVHAVIGMRRAGKTTFVSMRRRSTSSCATRRAAKS